MNYHPATAAATAAAAAATAAAPASFAAAKMQRRVVMDTQLHLVQLSLCCSSNQDFQMADLLQFQGVQQAAMLQHQFRHVRRQHRNQHALLLLLLLLLPPPLLPHPTV